jgi:hypothetical protein
MFAPAGKRLLAGLLFVFVSFASLAADLSATDVATKLDLLKGAISEELTARMMTNEMRGSYTTVWRQFEDAAIDTLEAILPRHMPELTLNDFDDGRRKTGREKNRLADFAILCGTNVIEISIKAARNSAQPENDLGTFRDHPNREKLFAASFTVWVRYEDAGGTLRAERVFFDRTWRFVGKSTLVDGVKYRKKDGNMRPKPWAMFDSGKSYWANEAQFEEAVNRSGTFRANELVKEYLNDLGDEDQRILYERLKEKFVTGTPPAR